jgi:hypothetical protein
MEELQHIGLITDPKTKQIYIDKFGKNLISGVDYQVYISSKHGSGSGSYKVSEVAVTGQNMTLLIDFLVGDFEMGSAVMNQRILFFKTEPGCKIVDVITTKKTSNHKHNNGTFGYYYTA